MNILLLDTNVVSILFKKNHPKRQACIEAITGRQLVISFMTRAELLLWPAVNNWGEARRAALLQHIGLYTTLYADEQTCAIWVEVVARASVPEGRSRPRMRGSLPPPDSGAFRW